MHHCLLVGSPFRAERGRLKKVGCIRLKQAPAGCVLLFCSQRLRWLLVREALGTKTVSGC
jgi:hypothetical protein